LECLLSGLSEPSDPHNKNYSSPVDVPKHPVWKPLTTLSRMRPHLWFCKEAISSCGKPFALRT
jgi:hypothetical protein